MSDLAIVNYHGWKMLQSNEAAVGPYFSNTIMARIHQKKSTNITVVGEAGIGKSYMAINIARMLEGKTASGEDRFSVEQIVFNYKDFMDLVLMLKPGKVIIFDEPSYSLSHRDWYKELQSALVKTIESMRYKIHPLIIPVINSNLLDKTIREYLISFQVVMTERGKGTVYRIKPSQFNEKIYREYLCELHYRMFDRDVCSKDTCLSCNQLDKCTIFRAQYERKKASIQEERYGQAAEMAQKTEAKRWTLLQIEAMAYELKDQWFLEGNIDTLKLGIALADAHGIRLGNNKRYELKSMLETHHPELAPQ